MLQFHCSLQPKRNIQSSFQSTLFLTIIRFLFYLGHENQGLLDENFSGVSSSKDQPNNFDNDNEEVSLRRMNGQQLHPSKIVQNNPRGTNGISCPSCGDYFDSGKKRRLIDNCGHERCYTCMFNKGFCSLCNEQGMQHFNTFLPYML